MDCLLQTKWCETNLCESKCCEHLVCVWKPNDHMFPELQQAFRQQSNYYRGLIALQCPLDTCKTRAQFFSESSVNSPIYDSRCDSFHQTTIMTNACNRVIQEYCTENIANADFDDFQICNQFVNTQSLFIAHNWITECGQAINETKAGQYPIMTNVCYYVVIEECVTSNECPCIEKRYVNDTFVQVIPCLFNECSPQLNTPPITIIVVAMFIFLVILYELRHYSINVEKQGNIMKY